MGKIRVLIADDNDTIRQVTADYIRSDSELELIAAVGDGLEAYSVIQSQKPDVVVLDLIMPRLDGMAVLELIKSDSELKDRTAVLIISVVNNDTIVEDAFSKGAGFYVLKPTTSNNLISKIKSVYKNQIGDRASSGEEESIKRSAPNDSNLIESYITGYLREMGIPAKLSGFHYLRDGIHILYDQDSALEHSMQELYEMIGKNHNIRAVNVERSIRNAIKMGVQQGEQDMYQLLFSGSMKKKGHPSATEFMVAGVDQVKYRKWEAEIG